MDILKARGQVKSRKVTVTTALVAASLICSRAVAQGLDSPAPPESAAISPITKTPLEQTKGGGAGTGGWRTLRWGMTPAEVNIVLRDPTGEFQSSTDCGTDDSQKECWVGADSHHFKLGSRVAPISLSFESGRLKYVSMRFSGAFQQNDPATQLKTLIDIREQMSRQFGEAWEQTPVPTIDQFIDRSVSGRAKWIGSGTTIDLYSSGKAGERSIDVWIFVSECSTCTPPPVVARQPFARDTKWQDHFFSRRFWEKLDWARLPSNLLVKTLPSAESLDPKKRQIFFGRIQKLGDKALGDLRVQLALVRRDGSHKFPYGIVLFTTELFGEKQYKGPTGKQCREVLARMEGALGKSAVKHDRPHSMGSLGSSTSLRAQWDVGESRIGFSCLAMDFAEGGVSGDFTVTAWHRSVEEKDVELAWIRCTQSIEVTIDGRKQPIEQRPDVYFALDEWKKSTLLDGELNYVSGASVSESEIKFTRDSAKRKDEARINRLSGQYKEVRTLKDANVTAEVSGHCERSEPTKTGF